MYKSYSDFPVTEIPRKTGLLLFLDVIYFWELGWLPNFWTRPIFWHFLFLNNFISNWELVNLGINLILSSTVSVIIQNKILAFRIWNFVQKCSYILCSFQIKQVLNGMLKESNFLGSDFIREISRGKMAQRTRRRKMYQNRDFGLFQTKI